jgi:hypothetical protein
MTHKKWVKFFLATVLTVISLFALFNYTIDPLWTFCHSNRLNNAQPGFDERQLKTNRAYFCGLEQYDSLLLGSSRTTYINQHDFKTMNVFNYASVSMYPNEYRGWIEKAKKIKGTPFKTIIIGDDFAASSIGELAQHQIKNTPPPSHYIDISTSFMYRYKMLFTMDTLSRSIEAIEHSKHIGTIDYSRDNVKHSMHISAERKQQALNHQIPLYYNVVYGEKYKYNTKLRYYFEAIKKENPHTRFIIFTTPISAKLFNMLVERGNLDDYKRWIRMMVDVFGEVYDFMGVNSITKDPMIYADLHHFYPEFGILIADRVTGVANKNLPDDFGILVTKENLAIHLKQIEQQAKKLLK